MSVSKLLRRWATAKLRKRTDELEADLDAERRKVKVLESERDNLAMCLARDRSRVEAEIAAHQRQRAEHEGIADGRIDQSVRGL